MVQLGLCSFRQGNTKDAHNALVDIQSGGRAKELLAQVSIIYVVNAYLVRKRYRVKWMARFPCVSKGVRYVQHWSLAGFNINKLKWGQQSGPNHVINVKRKNRIISLWCTRLELIDL